MPARALIPLGAALVALWIALFAAGDLSGDGAPRFLLLYFAAGLAFLFAAWAARSSEGTAPPAGGLRPEPPRVRQALWALLLVGLAARGASLWAAPSLSLDAYRYAWEGQIQLAGFDPYAHPPDDAALAHLRDAGWEQINHKEVSAIYGPLLQLLFAGLALFGGGLLPFKLAFVAADLAVGAVVFRGLVRARGSPLWVLLYLWHPLPILEVGAQAHLEVLPVLGLVAALELEASGRTRAAALALGASIAAKYLAVLVVPAFVLAQPGARNRLARLGWIALPGVLAAVPYLGAGVDLTRGLSAYGSTWRFNGSAFDLLDAALRGLGISQAFCRSILPAFVEVPPGFDPAEHTTWMLVPPKLAVGALLVACVAWASWPRGAGRDRVVDLERAAFTAVACFLIFSPTVHPWYGLWLVPFLPARAARGAPGTAGWLLLTLCLPLSYAATVGGWVERPWVRALEYGPAAALLVGGYALGRGRGNRGDGPELRGRGVK
jgi:hypothetical protein